MAVFAHLRGRHKRGILADVAAPAHDNKPPFYQVIGRPVPQREGLNQYGQAMSVTGDHVDELVFPVHQRLFVNPPGVHLPETVLTALGHKSDGGPFEPVIVLRLVPVAAALGRTIDNHGSALVGFLGGEVGVKTDALEPVHRIRTHRQAAPTPDQVLYLRALTGQRGILMKGNFVYPELLIVIAQQANKGFPYGTRPDNVNYFPCHSALSVFQGLGWIHYCERLLRSRSQVRSTYASITTQTLMMQASR